jgi:hypothetical protein
MASSYSDALQKIVDRLTFRPEICFQCAKICDRLNTLLGCKLVCFRSSRCSIGGILRHCRDEFMHASELTSSQYCLDQSFCFSSYFYLHIPSHLPLSVLRPLSHKHRYKSTVSNEVPLSAPCSYALVPHSLKVNA